MICDEYSNDTHDNAGAAESFLNEYEKSLLKILLKLIKHQL